MSTRPDLFGKKHLVIATAARTKMPSKSWLRIDEVAAYLDVSENTVRNWMDSGDLRGFKKGQTIRISKQELRRFIGRNRTDAEDYNQFKERRVAIALFKTAASRPILPLVKHDTKRARQVAGDVWNSVKNIIREKQGEF